MKEREGARLAIFNEDSSLRAAQQLFPGESFWVSGTDAETEGIWYWIDEIGLTCTEGIEGKWKRKEPNGGTKENCIAVTSAGQFNDLFCGSERNFLCQIPPKSESKEAEFIPLKASLTIYQ